MKLSKLSKFLSFILVCISCSSQNTISRQPVSHTPISPFVTDDLLNIPQLAFTGYISSPAEFVTPTLEISDAFTPEEKYLVRARTEKLFDKREELFIDFGQIAESAFSFPLPNARIISPYGTRRGRNHTGIDLKTYANDTIRAAFDGIVRIAGRSHGYGNVVVLRHYNGIETVYGHNSRLLVKAGEKVYAGMPVSLEGRTGRATTEHLHFETRIDGQPFDPNLIIDFISQKLHNRCLVFTPDSKGKIRIDQI